jgi:ferredoxin
MRVVVDLAACQGYAQCAFLAPEAFRLSGPEALLYGPNPPDSSLERVRRAAAACPVQAISAEAPGIGAGTDARAGPDAHAGTGPASGTGTTSEAPDAG